MRRMLWRARGWVYGSFMSEFGNVVRRLGVFETVGDGRTWFDMSLELKEKTGCAGLDSTPPADIGGVAVIALGKTRAATAGDAGCALRGVSKYGPRYGLLAWSCGGRMESCTVWTRRDGLVLMAVWGSGVERSMAVT